MGWMNLLLRTLFTVALVAGNAQAREWEPEPPHKQVPLWPAGKIPDTQPVTGPLNEWIPSDNLVGGKPWAAVENVATPTMTVYPAKGHNTGAAVVIFPGGGYWILAMDLEGTEVCDWLTSLGVTCVLLKYRVPGDKKFPRSGPYPKNPMALQDAQRALGLVRFNAAKWGIDPHKIGVLGFSAGGHLVVATSTEHERIYSPVDEADKVSCRPDFAVAIYPGHLTSEDNPLQLREHIRIPQNTPPTFLLHAQDDPVDPVEYSLAYFIALKNAGVPAEMHLYGEGGHAFGLRRTDKAITEWPLLVERWLRTIGMIAEPPTPQTSAGKGVLGGAAAGLFKRRSP